MEHVEDEDRSERIMDIVNQLNVGIPATVDRAERDWLAQLNLEAGQRARATAAFDAAYAYFATGIGLLEDAGRGKCGGTEDSWERCYELTLELHEGIAEAAYVNRTSRLPRESHAPSWTERARAWIGSGPTRSGPRAT